MVDQLVEILAGNLLRHRTETPHWDGEPHLENLKIKQSKYEKLK